MKDAFTQQETDFFVLSKTTPKSLISLFLNDSGIFDKTPQSFSQCSSVIDDTTLYMCSVLQFSKPFHVDMLNNLGR